MEPDMGKSQKNMQQDATKSDASNETRFSFEALPNDLQFFIISFLNHQQFLRLHLVCKPFFKIIEENNVWEKRYQKKRSDIIKENISKQITKLSKEVKALNNKINWLKMDNAPEQSFQSTTNNSAPLHMPPTIPFFTSLPNFPSFFSKSTKKKNEKSISKDLARIETEKNEVTKKIDTLQQYLKDFKPFSLQ